MAIPKNQPQLKSILDKALSEQLALAKRYQRPLAIALFDLDYFKRVNDSFGRWGGEEFLLIFPETDKQQAFIAAEKIRQVLEKQLFEENIKQAVSVGVVEASPNSTVNDMLSLADKKLYLAKETGRNQVIY